MKIYTIQSPKYIDAVYRYTVYYLPKLTSLWEHRSFAGKSDAKLFGNSMRKNNVPDPYIVRDVVERTYFKSNIKTRRAK